MMEFKNVEDLVSRYKTIKNDIDTMKAAIKYLEGGQCELSIKKGGSCGYQLKFNNEIGEACYQAKLEELKQEKTDIEERMEGWK